LEKVGWFNNPENRKRFPFNAWGFNQNTVSYDNSSEIEQEEIERANEEYKDALVYPVFPQMKNSICALVIDDKHANLCRSMDDRRPIYDKWFERCQTDRKTGSIMCLKVDNYETLDTEAYPINIDGSLDINNLIIENKRRNGKCSIY